MSLILRFFGIPLSSFTLSSGLVGTEGLLALALFEDESLEVVSSRVSGTTRDDMTSETNDA